MRLSRRTRSLAAATATVMTMLAALAGCGQGKGGDRNGDAVVIEYNPTVYSWLGVLAQEHGFFKQNGVDARLQLIQNGTLATTALTSGDIDLAFLDLSLVSGYLNKGKSFTAVTGTGKLSWDIVAPHGDEPTQFPQSVAALKGQAIGVPALGSVAYYYAQSYLNTADVRPDDVRYVAVGPFAQVPAAISNGQVKAAVVTPDQTYQLQHTGRVDVLFDAQKDRGDVPSALQKVIGTPGSFYWGRTDWVDGNKQTVAAVQKSLAEADIWAHDPTNLDAVVAILNKLQLLPKTLSGAATHSYVAYALRLMSSVASVDDMRASVDYWRENGVLKVQADPSKLLSPGSPDSAADVRKVAAR